MVKITMVGAFGPAVVENMIVTSRHVTHTRTVALHLTLETPSLFLTLAL